MLPAQEISSLLAGVGLDSIIWALCSLWKLPRNSLPKTLLSEPPFWLSSRHLGGRKNMGLGQKKAVRSDASWVLIHTFTEHQLC